MYDGPLPACVTCSALVPRIFWRPSMTGAVPVTVHVALSSVPDSKSSQRATCASAQRVGPPNLEGSGERSRPESAPESVAESVTEPESEPESVSATEPESGSEPESAPGAPFEGPALDEEQAAPTTRARSAARGSIRSA